MEQEIAPIVVDVGSRMTKVGSANEPLPTHVFPSVVARPRKFHSSSKIPSDSIKFGQEAEEVTLGDMRDYVPKYPVRWGHITDWELYEDLMEHILFNLMKGRHEESPLLVSEVLHNPRAHRERCTQLMFETFNVPAMYLANTASLTAYSSGTLDGVVVECGSEATYIAPVYDGISLQYATPSYLYSVFDINVRLQELLKQKMRSEHPESEWSFAERHHQHVVRDILNKHCYFALDYQKELQKINDGLTETEYTLPDGSVLKLSKELIESTEVMFDSSLTEVLTDIPTRIPNVMNRIKLPEVKQAISGTIIVGGALSTLPGFTERLEKEVNLLINSDESESDQSTPGPTSGKVFQVRGFANRQYSAWIGGSVLASMSDFNRKYITKQEYNEYGPSMVHKKCFL